MTHPVEAGLPAELMGLGRAEVVVGPEGLVECRDEVEKSLPATLVTQGVVPVLAALPQPGHTHRQETKV